jgi:hypothetical protein
LDVTKAKTEAVEGLSSEDLLQNLKETNEEVRKMILALPQGKKVPWDKFMRIYALMLGEMELKMEIETREIEWLQNSRAELMGRLSSVQRLLY